MKSIILIFLCFGALLINGTSDNRFKRQAFNSWKKMHNAAGKGDVKKIIELLRSGTDVNILDGGKRTPLIKASERGQSEAIKVLIANGADINWKNNYGRAAIYEATLNDHYDAVSILIEHDADVNSQKDDKWTLLNMAAKKGYLRIVELLVKAGANVNMPSVDNQTPLYSAVLGGHDQIVSVLLESGADVNIVERNGGWSPLHQAVENRFQNIVYMLWHKKADINLKNGNNESPYDIAVRQGNQYMIDILTSGVTTSTATPTTETPTTVSPNTTTPAKMSQIPETTPTTITCATEAPPTLSSIRPVQHACQKYTNVRTIYTRWDGVKEFPWMVALGYANADQNKPMNFYCGGTIISNYFVLTAAHCVIWKRPSVVRMGTESITDGEARTVNRIIKDIIIHPGHSGESKANDLALLELADKISFSYFISPACLQADANDLPSNVTLWLGAWGAKSPDLNDGSKSLRKTELVSVSLTKCNATLMNLINHPSVRYGLTDGQYCAHDLQGRNDACKGDGGSALQYFSGNTRTATIIGIGSFSPQCNLKLPAVYTRVARYLDWIESHVWLKQINGTSPSCYVI